MGKPRGGAPADTAGANPTPERGSPDRRGQPPSLGDRTQERGRTSTGSSRWRSSTSSRVYWFDPPACPRGPTLAAPLEGPTPPTIAWSLAKQAKFSSSDRARRPGGPGTTTSVHVDHIHLDRPGSGRSLSGDIAAVLCRSVSASGRPEASWVQLPPWSGRSGSIPAEVATQPGATTR